jgi:transcriptional regulator with XRE-family HTH domain
MEPKDKKNIKLKFALAVNRILEQNKKKTASNKLDGTKDHKIVDSLRKLEAASGISFPIIQKVSKGEKNAALSTIVSIAEGLNLSLSEFFSYYDKVSDEEIKAESEKRKRRRSK